jgi:hypothetical protein
MGHAPYGSKVIDPEVGAPQADICFQYKMALIRTTAEDKATRAEERLARRQVRAINPDNIQTLIERYLALMPYKTTSARFHSFVVYFSNLQRLGWVEATGREDPSAFQDHYKPGPSRKYFRLTEAGRQAGDAAWSNPQLALYPKR